METTPKSCLNCSKPLKGRIDKKFCDDYCRNNYNNQIKSETGSNTYVRNINNHLSKNRRILRDLLQPEEDMAKVPHDKLTLLGFNFKYHTHRYTNKKGQTYFFCYEYGYLPLEHNWYLLVKRKEE